VVVPTKDDYGFVINLLPTPELLIRAEKYRVFEDQKAYQTLLPDDMKDDNPDDEKVRLHGSPPR
jgi:hypothetical protein